MFSSLAAPLQEVHLEVVPIAGRNHEVNLTAIVLPTEANLTVFYWWIGDNQQVNFVLELYLLSSKYIRLLNTKVWFSWILCGFITTHDPNYISHCPYIHCSFSFPFIYLFFWIFTAKYNNNAKTAVGLTQFKNLFSSSPTWDQQKWWTVYADETG